jgi:MarR family transcriptional regulator, organic hydroperoxide resistance regulator
MDKCKLFSHCLYFTVNTFSRFVTRMAEQEFKHTGLSPSYAFLMMLVIETPGIGQKELSEKLNLAPSTVTRFIDSLANRGFLYREVLGKSSKIYPLEKGIELEEVIGKCWKNFYIRYCEILGTDEANKLAGAIHNANMILEKN